MNGKLILVVGPSGVGKDTLLDHARAELADDPGFHFVRRAITRPAEAGGEDHEPVSNEEFERRAAAGEFFATWQAHGLSYGIPIGIVERLQAGQNVIVNASRRAIPGIAKRYPELFVIGIDAPPEIVAQRLLSRGRESAEDVAKRIAREAPAPEPGVAYATVMNAGTVEEGSAQLVDAILGVAVLSLRVRRAALDVWREPFCILNAESQIVRAANLKDATMVEITSDAGSVRTRLALTTDDRIAARAEAALSSLAFDQLGAIEGTAVTVQKSPSPKSRSVLRKKIGGNELDASDISLVVRDMVEGRYAPAETAGFLVAASSNLSFDEIVALTRVRAEYMKRFKWDAERVVDKHSMGGVPGSRITLIVVPIVAAHGLLIPKTSSRAITSAAGTADTMEVAAKVDLSHPEMTSVVEACFGCIAWNGRVNHSPVDDVMNAINRPLGLSSRLLDVSSILSKKLAAGSTHVLIDIPYGPYAKLKTADSARELGDLFERVGAAVGLNVAAQPSEGFAPIGRGVGPALEMRDVLSVLGNRPDLPADLREKALVFAARILEWDPALLPGEGRKRAEELLLSGAAKEMFERIADAQGRHARPAAPGQYHREVLAPRSGTVKELDGFAIGGLARAAGAPSDKSAGVDILAALGDEVTEGQPVLRVHASQEAALARAFYEERAETAFQIG